MPRKPPSKAALRKRCDAEFSLYIRNRDGRCVVASWFPKIKCNGGLQCCHVISRRYGAIRWNPDNAVTGCAAHHLYGTHHPLEWEGAAMAYLGHGAHDELRLRALSEPPMDASETLAWLKSQREAAV